MQNIEEIYKEYFQVVNKYLFCLTHSNDLAEELTQETFYRAVKTIDKFKGNCKIQVGLCQIAKNLWFDELKRNKRYKDYDGESDILILKDNTEDAAILNYEKVDLFKKMQTLDEQPKEVIYLRLTGALSFREIGDILHKTEYWARVTFYIGKQKIKESD